MVGRQTDQTITLLFLRISQVWAYDPVFGLTPGDPHVFERYGHGLITYRLAQVPRGLIQQGLELLALVDRAHGMEGLGAMGWLLQAVDPLRMAGPNSMRTVRVAQPRVGTICRRRGPFELANRIWHRLIVNTLTSDVRFQAGDTHPHLKL